MMYHAYGDAFAGGGVDLFGMVTFLVILADLILLGVYLWKKISRE
jgi:hypothetical protein